MNYDAFYAQCQSAAMDSGIVLPEVLYLDGTIQRFNGEPEHHKGKDEWYVGYELDQAYVLVYGSWRNGGVKHQVTSWGDSKPNKEQQEAYRKAIEEARRSEEATQAEAKERAQKIWESGKQCVEHPYLDRKQIKSHGLRVIDDALVIPVYSAIDHQIQSLQKIWPDGRKQFLTGGRVKDGYFLLGEDRDRVDNPFVAEGYATAASVYEATGKPCLIAFSCHNCVNVGLHLRNQRKLDTARLLQDLGDSGEKIAKEWEEHKLGDVCAPYWGDNEAKSDWNDLAVDRGLEEVARQLRPARFPSMSVMDFMLLPHQKPEWVVDNLLSKGSVNMLFARDGLGKSILMLDIVMSIQKGMPVLGRATRKSHCLIVDGEMANWEINERIGSYMQRYEHFPEYLPIDDTPTIITAQMLEENGDPACNLYDPMHRKLLEPLMEDADFIVFDNLFCLTQRQTEDNYRADQAEWGDLAEWLRKYKNKGKTILVIHHTNKSGDMALSGLIRVEMQTVIQLTEAPKRFPNPDGDLAFEVTLPKTRHITGTYKLPFIATMYSATHPFRRKEIPDDVLAGGWQVIPFGTKEYEDAHKK